MFGTFRFVLANMVVLTHIGGVEIIAGIAVWSFFMLSGYLMTLILNNKYGFQSKGLKIFAVSRIIRLYPMYWFSILTASALIIMFDENVTARQINAQMMMPTNIGNIISTITILGTTVLGIGRPFSALSPSVWAVDIELIMYIISCIYLSRSHKYAKYIFIVCVLSFPMLWLLAKHFIRIGETELGNQITYSFILVALMPYSAGVLLFFNKDKISDYVRKVSLPVAVIITFITVFISVFIISKYSVTISYLLPMPVIALLIVTLSNYKINGSFISKIDNYLGLMSYPIYLLHWLSAYVVILIFSHYGIDELISTTGNNNIIKFNFYGYIVVSIMIMLFSVLSVHVIEKPIDRIRKIYKSRKLGL